MTPAAAAGTVRVRERDLPPPTLWGPVPFLFVCVMDLNSLSFDLLDSLASRSFAGSILVTNMPFMSPHLNRPPLSLRSQTLHLPGPPTDRPSNGSVLSPWNRS